MSDLFISYASEDKNRVKSLAHALEQKGWSVWWDRHIPAGRSFDEVIEEALDASKAVIVVWTKTSVKSQWVKNEAREGLRRRVLFPVMILEEVKIPLEFRDVQAAHLMDWQPEEEHPGFDQFVEDLAQVIGAPSKTGGHQPLVTQGQEPSPARVGKGFPGASTGAVRTKQSPPYLIIGAGVFVVVGAFAGQWFLSPIPSPRLVNPPPFQPPVQTPPTQSQVATPPEYQAQDIAQVKKGVAKIIAQVEGKNRVGSGVVVKLDEDHVYIVTASHVIEGDLHPNVFFYAAPHSSYPARVIGLEGRNPEGLGLLLVEGKIPSDLVALRLDHTAAVSGGEPITLIGFPRAEGSMWTVTTGTLSGRRGSALSFSGIADVGNSGGPVLFQNKVVGIVTEVGARFNTAVPAVVVRFALDGWGVRLSEEAR